MILKTYESDSRVSVTAEVFYLLILLLTLFILFPGLFFALAGRINIKPQRFFLFIAFTFGTIFVFLTPPMQTPDESIHFWRAYELSEFDFLQIRQTLPAPLILMSNRAADGYRVGDSHVNKASLLQYRIHPGERMPQWTFWYILLYLPQAAGILAGRMMNLPPLF